VIRAGNAAVLLAVLGGLLVFQVQVPDAVVFGWLLLLVIVGRSAVRLRSVRHRHRTADE
jgi:hypothetical protein